MNHHQFWLETSLMIEIDENRSILESSVRCVYNVRGGEMVRDSSWRPAYIKLGEGAERAQTCSILSRKG
jgi:methyl coenzyme M reductase subunit D